MNKRSDPRDVTNDIFWRGHRRRMWRVRAVVWGAWLAAAGALAWRVLC